MKTKSRGDVEVEVGVVDHVQPPQRWNGVEHDVLQVDDEVEDENGADERDKRGKTHGVQHPPTAVGREDGGADRGSGENDSHYQCAQQSDADVGDLETLD
jgi:hypothetical protein